MLNFNQGSLGRGPVQSIAMPVTASVVSNEADRLEKALDDLCHIKLQLFDRIDPVARPGWRDCTANTSAPPVREVQCPVASRLAGLADLVERQNDELRQLLQSIQL